MQTVKRARILNASAGAGKTFRLVLKYLCDVLEQPECYRTILAVTFTNKATEEMKSRIITELNRLAEGLSSNYLEKIKETTGLSEAKIRDMARIARTTILHDYSRFAVLTIDKFFLRILRAFINELSLDMNYNIEFDVKMLLERSADSLIESMSDANNEELKKWLTDFAKDRIDDSKFWDMRSDLSKFGAKLFSDGMSERLNNLVSKSELKDIIKALDKDDKRIVDDIVKIANDMLDTIKDHGLDLDDFKGKKSGFISYIVKYSKGEIPEIGKDLTKGIANALESKENWYNKPSSDNMVAAVNILIHKLREIHKLIATYKVKYNTTQLLRNNYRSYALLSDLYAKFEDICKKENIMVMDKTKELLAKFIDQSNAPFIYEKVGNRYDRYMIDEFQDTSIREWNNLSPLLVEALSSNENASVFIVGDIKQSIYRWRGGNWSLLNGQVIEDLGPDNIEVEPLFENHRSLKNIVTFNNMLIENIKERDNKYLNKLMSSCKAISENTTKELKDIVNKAYINCTQEPQNKSSEKGYAEVCEYDPKYEGETPLFIKAIEDAKRRGYNYNDILILVRWNSQGRKAAEALYAYKSTLTDEKDMFNILTSESLTIESCNVVRFIISTFRLAINHYDNVERAIFNEYLKRPYGMEFTTEDIEMLNTVAHLSPLEAFEYVVERFKLYEETKYIAYIQAVHDQIFAYVSNHVPDIQHYLSWWDERGHKESLSIEKTDQTIEITTIHKAKGLERDVVIIPYGELDMTPSSNRPPTIWAEARPLKDDDAHKRLSDIGEFPVVFGNAMMDSEFADEYYRELAMSHIDGLNILYVAVTRAKKELYMYIPQDLNPNKKSSKKKSEEQSNDDEPEVINTTTPLVINAVKEICKDNIHKELDASNEVKLIRYSYGEKCDVVNSVSENRSTIMDAYPTQKPNISVRKPSKRFLDEGLTPGTESCAKGIMLHKVFENAYNMQDLYNAIERLKTNNDVTAEEAEHLCANIDDALTNDLVAEWFNGEWDDIKCEAGIICKDNNIRPDRVMIKGNRAIVVDYKFGNKTSKSYNKKIKTYIDYLEKMKLYSDIEGYIWYVMLNKIEKV